MANWTWSIILIAAGVVLVAVYFIMRKKQ